MEKPFKTRSELERALLSGGRVLQHYGAMLPGIWLADPNLSLIVTTPQPLKEIPRVTWDSFVAHHRGRVKVQEDTADTQFRIYRVTPQRGGA